MFLLPVHAVRFLAPDLFELELERRGYPFTVGECAILFDGGDESRPYSFASGPEEPVLRFLIRRLAGGAVSTWLGERQRGDGVRISTPFGRFHPGQEGGPGERAVFIATGVGIAPFLSWVRQAAALKAPSPPPSPPRGEGDGEGGSEGGIAIPSPICLFGVRHACDVVYRDLLRAHTHLRLAVSREAAPGAYHGRVTALLPDLPLVPGAHYYLCGLDAMVDAVARWLAAQGVEPDYIHSEVFFNETR